MSNRVKVTVIKTQFGENTAKLYFQLSTPFKNIERICMNGPQFSMF